MVSPKRLSPLDQLPCTAYTLLMKALDPIMRSSSSSGITCIDKVQNMEIGIPSSEKVISDTLLFNSPTLELLNGIGPDGGVDIMVWWDEPVDEDTANPLNWSSTKKWTNICTISVISFIV